MSHFRSRPFVTGSYIKNNSFVNKVIYIIYNIFYVIIAWMDHVKHCSQFRIYIGLVWQSVTILWAHFHFQLVFQFKLNLSKVQTRMKAWNDELSVLLNEYCVESI